MSRRDISKRVILFGMKETLNSRYHLLHGPDFPLIRLHGIYLARSIPNAFAKINSLFIPGIFLIVLLFLPTLAAYLIDFAIVYTMKLRFSSALYYSKREQIRIISNVRQIYLKNSIVLQQYLLFTHCFVLKLRTVQNGGNLKNIFIYECFSSFPSIFFHSTFFLK